MANTTISPNMNLVVPTVGTDPGPDWANNINASLSIIDLHDHAAGQGVQISPPGIDINADLPFNGNNATTMRTVSFTAQSAPISGSELGCIYVSGKDLYYNDEDGNQVRITTGGNVNAGAGSISGLPSGTASASFAAGTFTWQSATNTPATMNMGPIVTGAVVANAKTVTLSASAALAANYAMTLPLTLPAGDAVYTVASSGAQTFYEPDNSSFGIDASKYQVLNLGISTGKIANGAVTKAKLAAAIYNYGDTASTVSITSTLFSVVATTTMTSTGRPVLVMLTSSVAGNVGSMFGATNAVTALQFDIRENSASYPVWNTSCTDSISPMPSFMFIIPAGAIGSNTYALRCRKITGGDPNATLANLAIFAMEL